MSGLKHRGLVWFVVPWLAGVGACAKQQVRPEPPPVATQAPEPQAPKASAEKTPSPLPLLYSPSKGVSEEVNHLLISRDGFHLVLTTGWWLSVFHIPSGEHQGGVNHKGVVSSLALDPNGEYVATTTFGMGGQNLGRLVNPYSGTLFAELEHPRRVSHIALHPDSRHVVTASIDRKLRLWDRFESTVVQEYEQPEYIASMALSPSGELVAVSNDHDAQESRVRLLEVRGGQERLSVEPRGKNALVHFSPNGQWLATVSGSWVQLWDVESGRERYAFEHPDAVSGFSFSPDGRYLVTTATAAYRECQSPECAFALVREVESGQVVARLRHEGVVQQVVFSQDGRYLASSNGTTAAHIWEVGTGTEVARLEAPTTALAFSPDGKYFAMGTHGVAYAVWPLEPVLSPSTPKPWRFELPKPTEGTSAP
jgi:WD40 repeat protein